MSCCCFSFKGFDHKVESYHCMETSTHCHMDVLGNPSSLLTNRWTSVSVFVISWKRKLFHRRFWSISMRSADHNTAPLGYPAASHRQESKECPKLVPKMSSSTHSYTTPVAALMDAVRSVCHTHILYGVGSHPPQRYPNDLCSIHRPLYRSHAAQTGFLWT